MLSAQYARDFGVASYESIGKQPMTLFLVSEDALTHGNFIAESYQAIKANPSWDLRLAKTHSQQRALPKPYQSLAKELDSAASSDALLMNVFCFPGFVNQEVASLFGVSQNDVPEFGIRGNVPLLHGGSDATEVDMRLGSTYVEAKLTEESFTSASSRQLARYERFADVFNIENLPRSDEDFLGYQLIRNVLAIASKPSARFLVIVDARRPDLMRDWWTIYGAIREGELRERCGFATWQELTVAAPERLRLFLRRKYGL
jgi:restriction endonuclease-like protein